MKAIWYTFLLLFFINTAYSQSTSAFCKLVPEWKNIKLVSGEIPDSLDRIMVVSNRPFVPENDEGVLFPNGIAEYRKVSYLEVACDGTNWLIKVRKSFEDAMQTLDKKKDILLFVHGHGKALPSLLPRGMNIAQRYDVSLILFDWPARNNNFNRSLARVRRCSGNFYNLLLNLKAYRRISMPKDQSLNILAHSLGNYFLSHFVVNGDWQYQQEPFVDNLIFSSPAIRAKEHGEVLSLLNISRNKYVTLNKNDIILKGANLLTSGRMLGNKVILPHATNTTYIHFTKIAGREHTYFTGYHKFEDDNKSVFKFFNTIIHGRKPLFPDSEFEKLNENEFMIQ